MSTMRPMRRFSRLTALAAIAGIMFPLFVVDAVAQNDLARHINDQYQNKTLILRGFYSGDHLKYDSSGRAINPNIPDDWTVAGVVRIESLSVSGERLIIEGKRIHLGWPDGKFQAMHDYDKEGKPDKDEEKNRTVLIEADLGLATVHAADNVLSQIFLNAGDDFASLVPDYWKSCVLAAANGQDSRHFPSCSFLPELLAVPGVVHEAGQNFEASRSGNQGIAKVIYRVGKDVTPPKMIYTSDPPYAEQARQARYPGAETLLVVIDQTGAVTNIRITTPLGMGLDQKAVNAAKKWRFDPAVKDGQPVAVEIEMKMDFHLY